MSDAATQSFTRFFQPLLTTFSNPSALVFLGIFVFFALRSYFSNSQPPAFSMGSVQQQAAIPAQKDYTPHELAQFDGRDEGTQVLMAVRGTVYDVSRGRGFYGPGGPYANFAGRDASRGLAKSDFAKEMLADLDGPIDALEGLDASEIQCLDEWEGFFASKYPAVGRLVEPKGGEAVEAAEAVDAAEAVEAVEKSKKDN